MALDLRPLGLGDILDRSFRLFRENLVTWLGIGALVLVPEALIVTPLMPNQSALLGQAGADRFAAWQRMVTLLPITLLAWGLAQAALTSAVADRMLDRPVSVKSAYRRALRRALPLFAAVLLTFLVVVAVIVVGAAPGLLLRMPWLSLVGGLLALVPAVWVALGWIMAPTVVVVETAGAFAALRRSWRLARKDRGRIFLLMLLLGLLSLVVQMTLSYAIGLVSRGELASELAKRLAQMATLPVTAAGYVLLYFDNRVRKEGFDLEMMAAAIGPAPSTSPPSVLLPP